MQHLNHLIMSVNFNTTAYRNDDMGFIKLGKPFKFVESKKKKKKKKKISQEVLISVIEKRNIK